MLSLEQVRQLEQKVELAISTIKRLSEERDSLKITIAEKDKRISELENMVVSFKDDQNRIESGIKSTLDLLNSLEDIAVSTQAKPETTSSKPTTSTQLTAAQQKQKDLDQILGKTSPEHGPSTQAADELDIY